MPTIVDQRIFLPTRDLAQSIDFYSRMGWKARFRDENLALMELGASRVFLQKHYQKEWADNTMVHLVVDDAVLWHEVAERVKVEGGFEDVSHSRAATRRLWCARHPCHRSRGCTAAFRSDGWSITPAQ